MITDQDIVTLNQFPHHTSDKQHRIVQQVQLSIHGQLQYVYDVRIEVSLQDYATIHDNALHTFHVILVDANNHLFRNAIVYPMY